MRTQDRFEEIKVEGVEKIVKSLERLFVCCKAQVQDLKVKQRRMVNEARPEARKKRDLLGSMRRKHQEVWRSRWLELRQSKSQTSPDGAAHRRRAG